jgi:hypothetical protein
VKRYLVILGIIVAALAAAAPVAASDATTLSGTLSPPADNPNAGAHGRGTAALTISADRTHLEWRVTYVGTSSPITSVAFCAGTKPREIPIDSTCGFVIDQAAGGPSPITGSRTILPGQADNLSSGFTVIQLGSAAGPELSGYIAIGPALPDVLPDTAMVGPSEPRSSTVDPLRPLIVGLVAIAVLALIQARRRPPLEA